MGSLGDKFEKQISRNNVGRYNDQIQDTSDAIWELTKATADLEYGEGVTISALPAPTDKEVHNAEALAETIMVDMLPAMEKAKEMQRTTASDIMAQSAAVHTLKGSYEVLSETITTRLSALAQVARDQLPAFFEGAFTAIMDSTQSFGEYMMDVLGRLIKKAAALAATFAVLAVLTGGATGVAELTGGKAGFGAFMGAGMGIPGFASGGLVTGPVLGMVGEGPGTSMSNPEVIAPLDKLKSMIGGGNITVSGMIRGNDILISNERSLLDRNRIRGF